MRRIGWLLLVLVGLMWVASRLPSERNSPAEDPAAAWRRTSHGWEQLDVQSAAERSTSPTLHPAIVGCLQVLLTLMALVAFSAADSGRAKRGD
jgi:hypothetical protein